MNDAATLSPALLESLTRTFQGYAPEKLLWLVSRCLDAPGRPGEEARAVLAILSREDERPWRLSDEALPSLARLLCDGLSQDDAAVRARCAASAEPLAAKPALHNHLEPLVAALGARLSDDAAEVALAAAQRLWGFARAEVALAPVTAPLEAARQSPHEDVPYFASLALSLEAHRRGQAAPPLCAPTGEPDISALVRRGSYESYQCSHRLALPETAPPPAAGRCLVCGDPNARRVKDESFGSNAGGTYSYDYHCERCGKFTHYERDWG